jgi:hypothetical protein
MTTPNTTPLTYNGYVTQIATMAIVNTTTASGVVVGVDVAFNNIIPQMLNYAELRIQRDLDMLPALVENTTYSLTTGNNLLVVSPNDFVTIKTITLTSGTSKIPLLPSTKEFLQNVYNDSSVTGVPLFFAMAGGDTATGGTTANNIYVGPFPNQNYPLTIRGEQRVPSLYKYANTVDAATKTTFISTYYPDLLIMASMIYISAYQRNFGRMSDDPAMAQSYESQYQALVKAAVTEEDRKKFQASAWSSDSNSQSATPTR